jgi:translation initiation factor IF-3
VGERKLEDRVRSDDRHFNRAGQPLPKPPAPTTCSIAIQLQQIRVNNRIRAREVRVIIGSTGQQLGVMKLSDALRQAQSMGLDLVEVAAQAQPPVCRIVDYGKFKYEVAKHDKEKKNAGSKLKEIKFRVNVAGHDYETKLRHAEEFLDKGNKVRIQLQFRGREMAHQELGRELMVRVKNDLAGMANVEQEPKQQGRNVAMTLAPLPPAKRKRRFAHDKDLPPLEDDHDEEEEDEDEVENESDADEAEDAPAAPPEARNSK